MKSSLKWIVIALALLAVAALGIWGLNKRQAAAAASAAAQSKAEPVVELAAADVMTLKTVELSQGVPISGSIKAVQSAVVKAKVAGDLAQLRVREGDAVKAGQVLARVDSSDYAARVRQAQETADAARAQIDIAQRQFDNNKALVDQGFISKTALDTSQASLQSAQANHKAALAALDIAKKTVNDTVLTAPIGGMVSQRLAQNGERVGIDARIVEIVDLNRLELEAQLPVSDSLQVRVGQTALLKVEGQAQEIRAVVSRINPSAAAGSRSVLVYLNVEGGDSLRQGVFVQGRLQTQQMQALAVPLSAVRMDKPQPYLQIIQSGRIAHQTVVLGARGEREEQTWVTINNIALDAVLLRASAGFIRETTAVKVLNQVAGS